MIVDVSIRRYFNPSTANYFLKYCNHAQNVFIRKQQLKNRVSVANFVNRHLNPSRDVQVFFLKYKNRIQIKYILKHLKITIHQRIMDTKVTCPNFWISYSVIYVIQERRSLNVTSRFFCFYLYNNENVFVYTVSFSEI